jgi:nitrogen fixation-related uncharacterized protein
MFIQVLAVISLILYAVGIPWLWWRARCGQ